MKHILTILFFTAACISAIAQSGGTTSAFSSGNIAVYRVGNGVRPLANASTLVFVDEYTPSGILVQSIALPRKTVAGAGLTAQGTTTSEGLLTRTADSKFLVLSGYNADTGVAQLNATSSLLVARSAARVDAGGTVAITTFGTFAFNGGVIRSVASANGTTLYLAGSNTGIRKATFGDTTTIRINATGSNAQGASYPSNFRAVNIFGGQLYAATASGAAYRMVTVGTGLPTDTGTAIANLPGVPTSISPNQFFFADLSATVPGFDVLYTADNGSTTGGIRKYSLVAGSWVSNGRAVPAITGTIGLTGMVSSGIVKLYTTSGSTTATSYVLYGLSDATGYNQTIAQTFSTVATAAANTAFRGVALTPESNNPSSDTDYFRSATTGNWNSTSTWESSADSVSWHLATLTPGANAASIIIRSPHVVTVTANVTASKPTVSSGGRLNVTLELC